MRCVASARTEKRRQSVQGAASWPRCLCSDREKTIRTHLDPLTFDDLSRGQSPPTRRRQAVLLSVASGKSEKELLCGSRMFCAGCFLREVRKEPPALCPKRGVALSCCASMAGRNLCAPACDAVRVLRGMQACGPCCVRRPVASDRAERARRQAPWRWGQSLSHRAGEIPCAGRGPFMVRGPAAGSKRRSLHGVSSGKHPSLSAPPQVLRERISPCPHWSIPPHLPASPALFRGLKPAKYAVPDPRAARSPCRLAVSPSLAAVRTGHRSLKNHEGRLSFPGMPKKTQQFSVVPTDFLNLKQKNSLSAVFPVDTSA